MRTVIRYFLLVVMVFTASIGFVHAETIDEVQSKKGALQAQRDQALKDLQAKNMSLAEIVNQVAEIYNQQQDMEGQKSGIEQSMTDIQNQMNDTQAKIDQLRGQAGAALVFYQSVDDTNPLIEQLFSNQGIGSKSYEEMSATNTIVEAGLDSISQAVDLQKQLGDQEKELEVKKTELENKIAEIEAKAAELNVLKDKVQRAAQAARENYDSAQTANVANQRLEALMQAAGCQPGQVYGVDCGQNQVQSTGAFLRPVSYGMITEEFQGYTGPYGKHTGIDIGQNGVGGPVYAAAPGQVIAAGNGIIAGGGNQVLIVHNYNGQQIITSYCHMSSILVSQGQSVTANTQIGTVGATGMVSGPHLHFEISSGAYGWNGGSWINPRQFVNFPPPYVWFTGR